MTLSEAWRQRWRGLWAVDLRSLAVLRALLGGIAAVDLAGRLRPLRAFHTDAGILPREWLVQWGEAWRLDLFLANGSTAFAALLVGAGLAAAGAFAAGHRTRLANLVLLAVLVSLHNRNPLVLVPGDGLLAGLLFWTVFLPMGARWSVDAALSTRPPPSEPRHASWASAALRLQALAPYLLAALTPAATRWPGLAEAGLLVTVAVASLAAFVGSGFWDRQARRRETGRRIRIYYDGTCGPCARTCRLLEVLLVLPRAEIAPAQAQGRAERLMRANDSWVVIDDDDVAHTQWAALVALLRHSPVFRGLGALLGLRFWERPGTAAWRALARRPRLRAAAGLLREREAGFEAGRAAQRLAGVLLLLALAWVTAGAAGLPHAVRDALSAPLRLLRLDAAWVPPASTGRDAARAVFPGTLEDGSEVDVLRPGSALSWNPSVPAAPEGRRWRAALQRLRDPELATARTHFGRWLCRRWNDGQAPGRRLARFSMTWVQPVAGAGGPAQSERSTLAWQDCIAGPPPAAR